MDNILYWLNCYIKKYILIHIKQTAELKTVSVIVLVLN